MLNYYYSDTIVGFLEKKADTIIGEISVNGRLGHINTELYAWEMQIKILKEVLQKYKGHLFFEFSIPRMGKRVDCLLIINNIVFIIEFKVGEKEFVNSNLEQVWDYALDLKNFHKPSHKLLLVPILVATHAKSIEINIIASSHNDNLISPLKSNSQNLGKIISDVLTFFQDTKNIDVAEYVGGSYSPTPTIIEAAIKLYNSHNVNEITRNDSDAINLNNTTE
jgi:hypothetical protein